MDFAAAAQVALEHGLLDPERPEIVCLIGSTRFCDAFASEGLRLTLEGKIVLSIGTTRQTDAEVFAGHGEDSSAIRETKRKLDRLHLHKVELSDSVLCLNVGGYIGDSTRRELAHARKLGRPVTFLEPDKAPEGCPPLERGLERAGSQRSGGSRSVPGGRYVGGAEG